MGVSTTAQVVQVSTTAQVVSYAFVYESWQMQIFMKESLNISIQYLHCWLCFVHHIVHTIHDNDPYDTSYNSLSDIMTDGCYTSYIYDWFVVEFMHMNFSSHLYSTFQLFTSLSMVVRSILLQIMSVDLLGFLLIFTGLSFYCSIYMVLSFTDLPYIDVSLNEK